MRAIQGLLFAVLFLAIFASAIAPSLAIKAGASVLFIAAVLLGAWTSRNTAK